MDDDPLVMSVDQAALALGISRTLAYALVREGVVPSIRLGRRLLVPRRRLMTLVEGTEIVNREPTQLPTESLTQKT